MNCMKWSSVVVDCSDIPGMQVYVENSGVFFSWPP